MIFDFEGLIGYRKLYICFYGTGYVPTSVHVYTILTSNIGVWGMKFENFDWNSNLFMDSLSQIHMYNWLERFVISISKKKCLLKNYKGFK